MNSGLLERSYDWTQLMSDRGFGPQQAVHWFISHPGKGEERGRRKDLRLSVCLLAYFCNLKYISKMEKKVYFRQHSMPYKFTFYSIFPH